VAAGAALRIKKTLLGADELLLKLGINPIEANKYS